MWETARGIIAPSLLNLLSVLGIPLAAIDYSGKPR
jgi:hypothetical protein